MLFILGTLYLNLRVLRLHTGEVCGKHTPHSCPQGQLQLGVCRTHHLLAVSLLWLGIFHIFPVHVQKKLQLFDGFKFWCGWAFSNSSLSRTKYEEMKCFWLFLPAISHQIYKSPAGHQHLWCGSSLSLFLCAALNANCVHSIQNNNTTSYVHRSKREINSIRLGLLVPGYDDILTKVLRDAVSMK